MSTSRPFLFAICVIAAGCPKSSSHEPDFAVPDAGIDFGQRGTMDDFAVANAYCQPTCSGVNNVCCVVPTASGSSASCVAPGGCPDGGVFTSCTKPTDCSGTTPICCETVSYVPAVGDGGTMVNGGDVACAASCPAGLNMSTNTYQTKICGAQSDCSGYQGSFPTDNGPATVAFDGCCSSPRAPGLYYCIPSSEATGQTCL
jgi:hypothetical protein